MSVSAVGMGTLYNMVYRDERGDHILRPRGRWLAWHPKARAILLCEKRRGRGSRLSSDVKRIHRRFHDSPTRSSILTEWPQPQGPVKAFGLLRELTYKVPKGILSPQKNPYLWRHQFGDYGQFSHLPPDTDFNCPLRFTPYIAKDSVGNLYIIRRPGNKYYLGKWLMW